MGYPTYNPGGYRAGFGPTPIPNDGRIQAVPPAGVWAAHRNRRAARLLLRRISAPRMNAAERRTADSAFAHE